MNRRDVTAVLIVLCLLITASAAAGRRDPGVDRQDRTQGLGIPIPAPDMPLIKMVFPPAAQAGQQVVLFGVNYGSAPTVDFNGASVGFEAVLPRIGAFLTTVPATASSGPLVVTNHDTSQTSNTATFEKLPGVFTPVCSIQGTASDPSTAPLPGTIAVAISPVSGTFAGAGVADATGAFSIALDATGSYEMFLVPPLGSGYVEATYNPACPGTQDHQFVAGIALSGRVVDTTTTPVANADIEIDGTGSFSTEALSGPSGDFLVYVPADDYDVWVEAPIGSHLISEGFDAGSVGSTTDLGDLVLDMGVLISGELLEVDGGVSRPAAGASIEGVIDGAGTLVGSTGSIADGTFHLAVSPGSVLVLRVSAADDNYEGAAVNWLDNVSADIELDFPIEIYSAAAQLPDEPMITWLGPGVVQTGQPMVLDAVGIRGGNVAVRFADGVGGWIDGVDTHADGDRGLVLTTVPGGAADGPVYLRVDGIDGPEREIIVSPGVYDPGAETTTGTVTDGSSPVPGVLVGLVTEDCPEEALLDYAVTDAAGSYSVAHGTQQRFVAFLPPFSTNLVFQQTGIPSGTAGQTLGVSLTLGEAISARCVDSGTGPVGGSGPIADCVVSVEGAEGINEDFDEEVTGDASGNFAFGLTFGDYSFNLSGPFRSRFLRQPGGTDSILGPTDFGDQPLDSGYFVSGRVVDPSGAGLAGVDVSLVDANTFTEVARTTTVGAEGSFRAGVPLDLVQGWGYVFLFFNPADDQDVFIPPVFDRTHYHGDTWIYPAIQAQAVGHVKGTVVDSSQTPLAGVPVNLSHENYGGVDWTESCPDGTYDLKAPAGLVTIHAQPSIYDNCLADESWDNLHQGCGADYVAVTANTASTGHDFELEPAGSISGFVTDEFGPLPGITVCARNGTTEPECLSQCATTDGGGYYQFVGVPIGGDYIVETFGGGGYPGECWQNDPSCAAYTPVAVTYCTPTTGTDFVLSNEPASLLANISTRGFVGTGDDVLIGGFVVTGNSPKQVLVTARGPSLAGAGVPGVLTNPWLDLRAVTGTAVGTNDDWRTGGQEAAILATGYAPTDDFEAALIVTLDPGPYTPIVRGVNDVTGVGIVEAYALDGSNVDRLANVSTRGYVGTGDDVLIGGFVITGPEPKTVLVTAKGPSLAGAGVPGVLADPQFDLYTVTGTLLGSNDSWRAGGQEAAIQATGYAPGDDLEAAMIVSLPPGSYTPIVRGVGGGVGVGIVEVYELP